MSDIWEKITKDQDSVIKEIIMEADGVNDWLSTAESEFIELTDYDSEDRLEDEEDEDWL